MTDASGSQRALSGAAAALLGAYVITLNPLFLGAGVLCLAAYIFWQKSAAKAFSPANL